MTDSMGRSGCMRAGEGGQEAGLGLCIQSILPSGVPESPTTTEERSQMCCDGVQRSPFKFSLLLACRYEDNGGVPRSTTTFILTLRQPTVMETAHLLELILYIRRLAGPSWTEAVASNHSSWDPVRRETRKPKHHDRLGGGGRQAHPPQRHSQLQRLGFHLRPRPDLV